ncbi:MAG TPA: formyltransferase [Steroidobacteraceae bacterium]|nr:formyltransferase [Steroidobacteraceae bacterium]
MTAARAVVFGYHDVGVRCLQTLLSGGVEVPLVVTVRDDPTETQWFGSVAATAAEFGIEAVMPPDANSPQLQQRLAELQPDFIFSFYYRSMLSTSLLSTARYGALNMHGSLLPRYRGRAPVNWAILHGERETGATLHYMVERADAGDIVDQLAVPILQNDDARCVFAKVTVAAETILARSLPGLIAGSAPRHPQIIEPGQYFGRRRPEDGRIDWTWSAEQIHNLVRAVAPPFPSAYADVGDQRWFIHKTRVVPATAEPRAQAQLLSVDGQCYVECCDGSVLHLLQVASRDGPLILRGLAAALAKHPRML